MINLGTAAADDRTRFNLEPFTTAPGPRQGHYYRALRFEFEDEPNPRQFAACSFPAEYGETTRWTYIISEENRIYRKDLGGQGAPEFFPAAPLEAGWTKLD